VFPTTTIEIKPSRPTREAQSLKFETIRKEIVIKY
jgi:hypothetical protein